MSSSAKRMLLRRGLLFAVCLSGVGLAVLLTYPGWRIKNLMMDGREPLLRLIALQELGELREWSLEYLPPYLSSENPMDRQNALIVLSHLKHPESVPWAIAMLGDHDSTARDVGLHVLQEMTGQDFPADAESWSTWWASSGSQESIKAYQFSKDEL